MNLFREGYVSSKSSKDCLLKSVPTIFVEQLRQPTTTAIKLSYLLVIKRTSHVLL